MSVLRGSSNVISEGLQVWLLRGDFKAYFQEGRADTKVPQWRVGYTFRY